MNKYLKSTNSNLTKNNPKKVEDDFNSYPDSTSINGLWQWVVTDIRHWEGGDLY